MSEAELDPTKLMQVGGAFRVRPGRMKDYYGPVMASQDVFYLVPTLNMNTAAVAGAVGALGGAIGGALLGAGLAATGLSRPNAGPVATEIRTLPPQILRHPAWPKKIKQGQVIVLPREAIRSLAYSFWGHLTAKTDEFVFKMELSLLRRSKVVRFLRECGWEI